MTDWTVEAREVPLGGVRGLAVHRTLPHRDRPTIGAWCFVDHFGPTDEPMAVLPHPHIGLQTVTWPVAGQIRHRDRMGNDQVLRPGELNLMTSGDGVSHSEFSEGSTAGMHGVQLWVALPESARHGAPDFEHVAELPRVDGDGWSAVVLVGRLAQATSPARVHSPLVAAQISLAPGAVSIDVDASFEHGLLGLDGDLVIERESLAHRDLRYLAPGRRSLELVVEQPTTVLLIGGQPFDEDIIMWWNFVGRSHDEIDRARQDWQAEIEAAASAGARPRFGFVDGHDDRTIPAPPLPNARLTPRRRSR